MSSTTGGGAAGTSVEPSPALYNRFLVIHYRGFNSQVSDPEIPQLKMKLTRVFRSIAPAVPEDCCHEVAQVSVPLLACLLACLIVSCC